MEQRCPECGKLLQISAEELHLHGGVVVCPQCLSEFHTGDLPAEVDASTLLSRSLKVVPEHLTYTYCHQCGMKIPQGVHYCPYCGHMLKVVGDVAPLMPEEQPLPDMEPSVLVQPAEPDTAPEVAKEDTPAAEEPDGRKTVQRPWSPVLPNYRYLSHHNHAKDKASPGFCLVSLLVILLLLAVLAYILYKVYMLRYLN